MEKTTLIIASITIGMLIQLAVSGFTQARVDLYQAKLDYTKSICDKAHSEISGESEFNCGEMLDEMGMIYNCNYGGTHCRLERE